MKVKPQYLYGAVALLVIIFLIFFTANDENNTSKNITENEMPDDDVHKGLKNPMEAPPGKENVSGEIRHHMEVLKKEIEENPNDTLKMKEYADLLAAAHRQEEAVIYYYNILNINPRRSDILSSLAFIYYNQKDYSKASDLISKILLYEPDNTEAMYNLGAIAATMGNKPEARKKWEDLIENYPDSKEAKLAENSLKKL
jgi:tetratricopeptide (TPR) repeat protein